jgi:RNA polymerase sigma factor (sigma-70 family)
MNISPIRHEGVADIRNEAGGIDEIFRGLRRRLQGIAYRILGLNAEAEDVVQDVWMRCCEAGHAIDNAEAWLVSVTTHLAIDRLRTARIQSEYDVGMRLPESLPSDASPSPEQMLERVEDISIALLTVVERLTPEGRIAFLMREVFDADYSEISDTLGKSEVACRQLVRRAKTQMADKRKRFAVSPAAHLRLVEEFACALERGGAIRTTWPRWALH